MSDPERNTIDVAVELLDSFSPEELAEVLRCTAVLYREGAEELHTRWKNPREGDVWDIAAEGFERLAVEIDKEWQSLLPPEGLAELKEYGYIK